MYQVTAAKGAMIKGYGMTLEDGLWLEHSLVNYIMGTEDFAEETMASIEKRKLIYKAK